MTPDPVHYLFGRIWYLVFVSRGEKSEKRASTYEYFVRGGRHLCDAPVHARLCRPCARN